MGLPWSDQAYFIAIQFLHSVCVMCSYFLRAERMHLKEIESTLHLETRIHIRFL